MTHQALKWSKGDGLEPALPQQSFAEHISKKMARTYQFCIINIKAIVRDLKIQSWKLKI
jgi:hypothetical protein